MLLHRLFLCFALLSGSCGFVLTAVAAIAPQNVVVVANSKDRASLALAKFYMQQRAIPEANLFLVETATQETVTYDVFFDTVFNPLREQLVKAGWIGGTLTGDKDPMGRLVLTPAGHKIDFMVLCRLPLRTSRDAKRLSVELDGKKPALGQVNEASVDAELSLLASRPTPLVGPLGNPLFGKAPTPDVIYGEVVRVARLDGMAGAPERMIRMGLEAEQTGLRGIAYIDLGHRHASGDKWLNDAAEQLKGLHYPVIIEPNARIMDWRERADGAAFFFGWWSWTPKGPMLQKSYRFMPGALGWDIQSFSASTIRIPSRWAPIMIRGGITATVGNVHEPYLHLVHRPDLFVRGIVGGMSAGEAAYFSLPTLSWMCLFAGDPLYQPFKVGLDEQLAQVAADPQSAGAQYVVLRQAERLRAQSGDAAALGYLQAQAERVQGLALNYEIARLLAENKEAERALPYLEAFMRVGALRVEDIPLADRAARMLADLGRREDALRLYQMILTSPDIDDDAWVVYAPEMAPLSRALGKAEQADSWETKVKEINERRAEKLKKEKEEAARKAAERKAKAAGK